MIQSGAGEGAAVKKWLVRKILARVHVLLDGSGDSGALGLVYLNSMNEAG
jgi:hypothetical protein